MKPYIPQEVLHFTERDDFKKWKRERRVKFLENVVFVLILILLCLMCFYFGMLYQQDKQTSLKRVSNESAKFYKV